MHDPTRLSSTQIVLNQNSLVHKGFAICYNVISTVKGCMGLLTFYLGYRHAKKKAARKQVDDDPTCPICGYLASQHDDQGNCPSNP